MTNEEDTEAQKGETICRRFCSRSAETSPGLLTLLHPRCCPAPHTQSWVLARAVLVYPDLLLHGQGTLVDAGRNANEPDVVLLPPLRVTLLL